MRTALATMIVAAGVVAPQAPSAAAVAPAGNITTSHVATTSTVPAPSAPLAIQTGEYEYNCIGTDGSSFWIGPGRPTTDCRGSYLQKYLDGNLLATYNLAYGGGAAQNPPWDTGCVLAIAGGVALFVFPPSGAAAWVTLGGLSAAGLLHSCVVYRVAAEIRLQNGASDPRTSSAILVQMNGRGSLLQSAIHDRMSASRDCTDLWTPRRIFCSVRYPNHRSTW